MKKIYLTFFVFITLLPALSYAQGQRDTLPLTTQQIIRALIKSLDSTYTKPQVDSITNLLIQSINTKTDTSATEDIAEDVFDNKIAGYASEEYAANRAWASADSVMNKTADSLILKLYADFTQYDEEAPDETVFLVFQEPNSGVIYRATLGAIKVLLQEITGDTIDYTAAEVNAILGSLSGGTISQVLTKNSNDDYDFGWADATGGSGASQDSLDKKLYAEFNTEYPQATVPSVDNYIPVLTGTGNHYAALDDLPISSAVSSALSGKQNALGFTPENVSNKATNLTSPDNTKYPTTQAVVNALSALDSDLRDYVDGLIGGGGDTIWAISKVEMFSADQDSMIIQSDSGSVLILIISTLISGGYDSETIELLYDGIPLITGSFSTGELSQGDNLTLSAYVNVNTDDGVGFGLKIEEGLWLARQNATVITLKQVAMGGGQGMTAEQADALNRLWALAQPDTVVTLTAFTPVTDASVSTLYTSNVIGVNSANPDYSVIKTWTDIGEYRVRYDLRDTPTWSAWQSTAGYYRMVDSAQVRHTSSSEEETETEQTFYAGNDSEIFSVTTAAEVLPDAPTGFIAYGGTSETEIPMDWTDAVGDIDSVRIYEGSTNDTTAMTWIASVAQGVEAYNRTGRTAGTTYWYAVKSWNGELESYFSNPDSGTTLTSGGTYNTDSLLYQYVYTDLTNGSISSWTDRVQSLAIGTVDTTQRPIKNDDALWLNPSGSPYNDRLFIGTLTAIDTLYGSFTMEGIIFLTDTTDWQGIFKYGRGSGMAIHTRGNRFCFGVYDAGNTTAYRKDMFSTPFLNTWAYVVGSYNASTNTINFYLNGVSQANASTYLAESGEYIYVGEVTDGAKNVGVKYYAIRRGVAWTQQQAEDALNSTFIQGLLP